jgi:CHAD domain-containing protein
MPPSKKRAASPVAAADTNSVVGPPTIHDLCATHRVDLKHAEHVREMALDLFRVTADWHGLDESLLPVLEAGAYLHDVALRIDEGNHHTVGRDLVLESGLAGFSWQQTAMIACLISFHRKRVRPDDDAVFGALSEANGHAVLRLASILRVADGLDSSRSQSTRIAGATETCDGLFIRINGGKSDHRDEGIARANKKGNLWNKISTIPLLIAPVGVDLEPAPYVSSDSSMREAGARVSRHHLQNFAASLPGVRNGEDAESVHEARVSTRRMRAALRVFRRSMGGRDAVLPFVEELRFFARELGYVRDPDVLLNWLDSYTALAPKAHVAALTHFRAHILDERMRAHDKLKVTLDSERCVTFLEGFQAYLRGTVSDVTLKDRRVGKVAPRRIEQAWQRILAAEKHLREEQSIEAMHKLRIEVKRMRYSAEFFRSPYGNLLEPLIRDMVRVQDTLGGVHDMQVFMHHFGRAAAEADTNTTSGRATHRAMTLAIETCLAQQEHYKAQFHVLWQHLDAPAFREWMGRLRKRMERLG